MSLRVKFHRAIFFHMFGLCEHGEKQLWHAVLHEVLPALWIWREAVVAFSAVWGVAYFVSMEKSSCDMQYCVGCCLLCEHGEKQLWLHEVLPVGVTRTGWRGWRVLSINHRHSVKKLHTHLYVYEAWCLLKGLGNITKREGNACTVTLSSVRLCKLLANTLFSPFDS